MQDWFGHWIVGRRERRQTERAAALARDGLVVGGFRCRRGLSHTGMTYSSMTGIGSAVISMRVFGMGFAGM